MRRSLVVAACAVALVGAFALALALGVFGGDDAAGDLEKCTSGRAPLEQVDCLNGYVHRQAASGRVNPTLDELQRLFVNGDIDDCHILAHAFGHIAFTAIGRFDRALAAGGNQCTNGYQHGVVEAAISGAGTKVGQIKFGTVRTCFERPDADAVDACMHGLGHGYMYETNDNVERSLARCHAEIGDSGYAQRCADGVLMENSMQFMLRGENRFRKAVPRACSKLRLPLAELKGCYGEIGEVSMFVFGHELEKALAVCAQVGRKGARGWCEAGARSELELVQSKRG
jgi:hypothetical protein